MPRFDIFFFKQKTAYEMRISDWSSDVCSSDLAALARTGVTLQVEAGAAIETPLHLVFIGAPSDTDRAWHLRHTVDMGEGASLVLAEHHLATGAHRHLDTATLSLRLAAGARLRSDEHTSELQSLMRISYAVCCLKKKISTTD